MPRSLAAALAVTDIAFLVYWAVTGLAALSVVHVPDAWMYAHHDAPRVVAWNWSFLPLDLAFSISGLFAVRAGRRDDPLWRPLALVSLVLTMVAGGMAVGYWSLTGEIDPLWFGSNALLVVWPLAFLPALVCRLGAPSPA